MTRDADDVAQVQQAKKLERLFADNIKLDVDLQLLSLILQMRERGLAHQAQGHDAPGDAHLRFCGFQFRRRRFAPLANYFCGRVGKVEMVRVGVNA